MVLACNNTGRQKDQSRKDKDDGSEPVEYAQDLIQKEALKFIEVNKDTSFFLFLPYLIPHAELIVPEDSLLEKFRGNLLSEKIHKGNDYGENYNKHAYCSCDECHAIFAAMVARLDVYVAEENNVAETHPEIVGHMKKLFLEVHTENEV